MRSPLHLILLKNTPIFEQLQLEEALLRTEEKSFCIINTGSPRAIVMGMSGKPDQLLDMPKVLQHEIPIIKRFSGGGTVIVDENTLFATFIMAKNHLNISPYPESILRWSTDFYTAAWNIPSFQLQENDYCIGNQKCGGNAQYMRKDRWVHHTSFLWDYEKENMEFLLLPPKRPAYRQDRPHNDFLSRLKSHGASLEARIAQIQEELVKQFYIHPLDPLSLQHKPHRQSTALFPPERLS